MLLTFLRQFGQFRMMEHAYKMASHDAAHQRAVGVGLEKCYNEVSAACRRHELRVTELEDQLAKSETRHHNLVRSLKDYEKCVGAVSHALNEFDCMHGAWTTPEEDIGDQMPYDNEELTVGDDGFDALRYTKPNY